MPELTSFHPDPSHDEYAPIRIRQTKTGPWTVEDGTGVLCSIEAPTVLGRFGTYQGASQGSIKIVSGPYTWTLPMVATNMPLVGECAGFPEHELLYCGQVWRSGDNVPNHRQLGYLIHQRDRYEWRPSGPRLEVFRAGEPVFSFSRIWRDSELRQGFYIGIWPTHLPEEPVRSFLLALPVILLMEHSAQFPSD